MKKIFEVQDPNFYAEYKKFAENYSRFHITKHEEWFSQIKSERAQKVKEIMMFLDLDIPFNDLFAMDLLDARYVFVSENNFIKSINPLISSMLRKHYWTSNMIEHFLNSYGKGLSGSA